MPLFLSKRLDELAHRSISDKYNIHLCLIQRDTLFHYQPLDQRFRFPFITDYCSVCLARGSRCVKAGAIKAYFDLSRFSLIKGSESVMRFVAICRVSLDRGVR